MASTINNEFDIGEFDFDNFLEEVSLDNGISVAPTSEKYQIIFVIDASNSMQGYKIGAVNDAVNNALTKLRSLSKNNNKDIEVSVIGFANNLFRWTNGFVSASEFKFTYIEMVDGKSDVDAIFTELVRLADECMDITASRTVVLLTDGLPTVPYQAGLEHWRQTTAYSGTKRVCVSFEEDLEDLQSMEFLAAFVDGGKILSIKEHERIVSEILS